MNDKVVKTYWANKKVKTEDWFNESGQLNGISKKFNSMGVLLQETSYKNGIKDGLETFWEGMPNKEFKFITYTYVDGKLHGGKYLGVCSKQNIGHINTKTKWAKKLYLNNEEVVNQTLLDLYEYYNDLKWIKIYFNNSDNFYKNIEPYWTWDWKIIDTTDYNERFFHEYKINDLKKISKKISKQIVNGVFYDEQHLNVMSDILVYLKNLLDWFRKFFKKNTNVKEEYKTIHEITETQTPQMLQSLMKLIEDMYYNQHNLHNQDYVLNLPTTNYDLTKSKIEYYSNGEIKTEIRKPIPKSSTNTIVIEWFDTGKLKSVAEYNSVNKLDGVFIEYWPFGVKKCEYYYNNGKFDNRVKFYDAGGGFIKKLVWEDYEKIPQVYKIIKSKSKTVV